MRQRCRGTLRSMKGDVVDIFTNNIDMSDTEASEDLLGRTCEYCIAQFAEKEGVGGGEFYTPSSVVKTLVSILRPFDNCRVYDCCCGSGGMFVQSEKFIEAHSHKEVQFLFMDRKLTRILGKWQNEYGDSRHRCRSWTVQCRHFYSDLHPTLNVVWTDNHDMELSSKSLSVYIYSIRPD